jgi:alpha-L-fucosidase 2
MNGINVRRKHTMKMLTPARDWREAMPCGNGKLAALVYGNISPETILFNHESLWYEGCTSPLPDVSANLAELRNLLSQGDFQSANELYAGKLQEKGFAPQWPKFHPAFDLKIKMPSENAFSKYQRSLDFETGQTTVQWHDGDKKFERQFFISLADDIAVMRIRSKSNIKAGFQLCEPNICDAINDAGAFIKPRLNFTSVAKDNKIGLKVIGSDGGDYGAAMHVYTKGGNLQSGNDTTWTEQLTSIPFIRGAKFNEHGVISVSDAQEILIIIGLYIYEPSDEAIKKVHTRLAALPCDYDQLYSRHNKRFQSLFKSMRFELDIDKNRDSSNEELLLDAYQGQASKTLIERLFDFGRYMLLTSTIDANISPSLQGKWNGDYHPAWNSILVNNLNTEMFYWQALPGNLPETTFACFKYFESFMKDFRENAKKLWGCKGIFIPLVSGNATGLLQDTQSHVINFVGVAAWIAQLYYDYWLFTRDKDFLIKRAIPFMKEVVAFYEDFITTDEQGYNLFAPSNSPENAPRNSFSEDMDLNKTMNPGIPITINSTIDIALAKEVIGNMCRACEVVGIEKENIKKWRTLLKKMRPYRINEDGALAEWVHSGHTDNYAHRHLSHLYPLFPGFEITQEGQPQLFDACRIALEKRLCIGLESQTGWSLVHMANIYARLGLGDKALECLDIMSRTCVGQNLFTYHNDWRNMGVTLKLILGRNAPYQADAIMGTTAAVTEMLVFSTPDVIKLLPALPSKWHKGTIQGVMTRSNVEIDMTWDVNKESMDVSFRSQYGADVQVQFPYVVSAISGGTDGAVEDSCKGPQWRRLILPANGQVDLNVQLLIGEKDAIDICREM